MKLGRPHVITYQRAPRRISARARLARYKLAAALSLASMAALAAPGIAVASAAPAAATAPALSAAAPPISQVRGSVAYLESAYHVNQAEAIRRLVEQREMPKLTGFLAARFPGTYAGAWLDQAHGGLVVIEATQPTSLAGTLRALPGWVRTRPARAQYSLRALRQVAGRAASRLGKGYTVTIDQVANRVVARPLAAVRSGSLRAALAGPLAPDASNGGLLAAPSAAPAYHPDGFCDGTNCTPPFRAGLNLDLWSGTSSPVFLGRCTSGFNVVGSNGWVYSTTAGHCFDGNVYADSNNATWVGYWQAGSYWNDTYPYDYTIAPFVVTSSTNYGVYWLGGQPRNRVFTSGNSTFPITGYYTYAQIGIGWVVCDRGEFTGSNCGQVVGKDGGIITNICVHSGDSGSPLFSQIDNTAYGILHGDNTTDDSCLGNFESAFTPVSNFIGIQSDGVTISIATS